MAACRSFTGTAQKAFWHDPTKNKNRFDEETHEFVPRQPWP